MSAIPEDLDTLLDRIADMSDDITATTALRWDVGRPAHAAMSESDRHALYRAIVKLTSKDHGGVLVVVLHQDVEVGGELATSVKEQVGALAGGALIDDQVTEVLEGRALAFHLAHAEEIGAPSAELELVDTSARDLVTEPFHRAAKATPAAPQEDDDVVATTKQRQMMAMNAAARDGVSFRPTVAGVLAFHPEPSRVIPGAIIVADAQTGAGFAGAMAVAIHAAAHWASGHGFPQHAVTEMLRNAWVHRDWSPELRSQPIHLLVGRRRLDVVSPGKLGEGDGPPNPVLHELCRRAGLIGGMGTGLDDLWADLAEDGRCQFEIGTFGPNVRARITLSGAPGVAAAVVSRGQPPPRSAAGANSRQSRAMGATVASPAWRPTGDRERAPARPPTGRATPPARPTNAPSKAELRHVSKPAPSTVKHRATAPLNARDQELMAFVAGQREVTCRQIQDDLGWTRSTARDALARLVASGHLRRTSADPRSPTQAYVSA